MSKSIKGAILKHFHWVEKETILLILQLEEDARLELAGPGLGALNIQVSSEEILQSSFGAELTRKIAALFPEARTHFLIRPEAQAIQQVLEGEAHLALITQDPPAGVESKVLRKVEFRTCASSEHPLLKKSSHRQTIAIEEILKHPFVSPDAAILGRIAKASSVDGWRDDKFPRTIKYKVSGLKLLENLIREGLALGYLPDSFVESAGLVLLRISGCPYSCQQTIRMISRDPSQLGWLGRLWDKI